MGVRCVRGARCVQMTKKVPMHDCFELKKNVWLSATYICEHIDAYDGCHSLIRIPCMRITFLITHLTHHISLYVNLRFIFVACMCTDRAVLLRAFIVTLTHSKIK